MCYKNCTRLTFKKAGEVTCAHGSWLASCPKQCILSVALRVPVIGLDRDTSIDAFVKGAARRVDGEELFLLFDKLLVTCGQVGDLVHVRNTVVRTIAGNLASHTGEHASQRLVITL